MVSSSPKASSKEMEGNALIGVDKDSKGKEVDLSTYKGKVLLVVNVVSKCGLADSNYTQLTEVYNKYKKMELTYNLSNLEVLLLRGNLLNGTLPMEGLTSFRHLQILDLSENNFFASIPPSIGALSSLKALSLAQNNRSGSLPIRVSQLYGEILEENGIDLAEMKILRRKMEELGIDSNICKPGQYNHLSCPMCKVRLLYLSWAFYCVKNSALWTCFQAKCGWRGNTGAYVNGNSTSGRIAHIPKVKQAREITEKSLDLEPTCSEVWRFLINFADVLGLWPFMLDEFVQAFHDYFQDPRLLGEIHVALLWSIIKDIEDVARTPSSTGLGVNQNTAANPGGGHPQIVEGAYAWSFDIRSWQRHLNPLTWPEILRQFALSAGFGPKLKKRSIEKAYLRDELRTSFGIIQQKHI